MSAEVVALAGGTVSYGRARALDGVDLRVTRGELVAVLGANGSGKSTLVRALLGLVPLQPGTLELFGTPLSQFRDWVRIGYVPQRAGAATGVPATVREVVASGRLARMRRLRRAGAQDRRAISTALDLVGLSERAGDTVGSLSGGQQQRVLIARALAGEPDLLILDEPTSGVDLDSQQALAAGLGQLVQAGVAVVLVAHELGPLHPLIGRAVTLHGGRVLHDGPPPELEHLHLHDPEHAHPVHEEPSRGVWGMR